MLVSMVAYTLVAGFREAYDVVEVVTESACSWC